MNDRHDEEGFEKIDGTLSFGGNGVGSDKTSFDKEDMIEGVTGLEDGFAFGEFFGRELRKESSDLNKLGFGHKRFSLYT